MNKYESKKNENEEIKNKLTENIAIKNDNRVQKDLKLDYIDIKVKEEEKIHVQLLLKFRANNKKIKEFMDKVKEKKKELDKYDKILKRQEKINKIYLGSVQI